MSDLGEKARQADQRRLTDGGAKCRDEHVQDEARTVLERTHHTEYQHSDGDSVESESGPFQSRSSEASKRHESSEVERGTSRGPLTDAGQRSR